MSCKFVIEARPELRRHAVGIAEAHAFLGQPLQRLLRARGSPVGLVGILVTELVERNCRRSSTAPSRRRPPGNPGTGAPSPPAASGDARHWRRGGSRRRRASSSRGCRSARPAAGGARAGGRARRWSRAAARRNGGRAEQERQPAMVARHRRSACHQADVTGKSFRQGAERRIQRSSGRAPGTTPSIMPLPHSRRSCRSRWHSTLLRRAGCRR